MTWGEWTWIQSAVPPAEIHSQKNCFVLCWIWEDPVFLGTYRLRSNLLCLPRCPPMQYSAQSGEKLLPWQPCIHDWISGKQEVALKACFYFITLWVCPCSLYKHFVETGRRNLWQVQPLKLKASPYSDSYILLHSDLRDLALFSKFLISYCNYLFTCLPSSLP